MGSVGLEMVVFSVLDGALWVWGLGFVDKNFYLSIMSLYVNLV